MSFLTVFLPFHRQENVLQPLSPLSAKHGDRIFARSCFVSGVFCQVGVPVRFGRTQTPTNGFSPSCLFMQARKTPSSSNAVFAVWDDLLYAGWPRLKFRARLVPGRVTCRSASPVEAQQGFWSHFWASVSNFYSDPTLLSAFRLPLDLKSDR